MSIGPRSHAAGRQRAYMPSRVPGPLVSTTLTNTSKTMLRRRFHSRTRRSAGVSGRDDAAAASLASSTSALISCVSTVTSKSSSARSQVQGTSFGATRAIQASTRSSKKLQRVAAPVAAPLSAHAVKGVAGTRVAKSCATLACTTRSCTANWSPRLAVCAWSRYCTSGSGATVAGKFESRCALSSARAAHADRTPRPAPAV